MDIDRYEATVLIYITGIVLQLVYLLYKAFKNSKDGKWDLYNTYPGMKIFAWPAVLAIILVIYVLGFLVNRKLKNVSFYSRK